MLFLSSLGARSDLADEEALSRTAYITKPVRQSALLDALVDMFLGDRTGQEPVPQAPDTSGERRQHRARILLVEDNAVNQKVAVGILQRENHDVIAANNGREALECLECHSFDIVLMDVQMPEMDGFEATHRIRASDRWRHLPIIAMTAHAMKGDRERCLEVGMDDYIVKPIRAGDLIDMVEKWTTDRTAQHAHGRPNGITEPEEGRPQRGPSETPLDVQAAVSQLGDDRELFDEALEVFIENIPMTLQQLRSALDTGATDSVELAAHSLKGAASNICAEPVRRAAQQLEQLGRDGSLHNAGSLLVELERHLQTLQDYASKLQSQ